MNRRRKRLEIHVEPQFIRESRLHLLDLDAVNQQFGRFKHDFAFCKQLHLDNGMRNHKVSPFGSSSVGVQIGWLHLTHSHQTYRRFHHHRHQSILKIPHIHVLHRNPSLSHRYQSQLSIIRERRKLQINKALAALVLNIGSMQVPTDIEMNSHFPEQSRHRVRIQKCQRKMSVGDRD